MNVTIGKGVKVNVVKDDTVMPLKLGGVSGLGDGAVEVATTTEWGIFRIIRRRWEDIGGSFCELVSGIIFLAFSSS